MHDIESRDENFFLPKEGENLLRPYKKVLRPKNIEETLQTAVKEELEQTVLVFRLKRDANIEPFDILALEGIEIPVKDKKQQTDYISEIARDLHKLNINKDEEKEEIGENEEKEEKEEKDDAETKKKENNEPLAGLLFTDDPEDNKKLVLKRIDASTILELKDDPDAFRENYRRMYTEEMGKQKRDNILAEKRLKYMKDDKKDKKVKIYDVDIKKADSKENDVLQCNGKPMVVKNLLQMALKNKCDVEDEEEKDAEYDYYFVKKAQEKEAEGAYKVALDAATRGIVSSHFAEDDIVVDGKDSDEDWNKDVDNQDSNDEDNPNNSYPEEAESGGYNSEEEDDYYGGGYGYGDGDGDYDDDEDRDYDDDDDGYVGRNNICVEDVFKRNFFSKIKEINKDEEDFEWPGK